MQQVQLFIKDESSVYQRIELFKDETISLTQSIQNVKDVAKVLQTLLRLSRFLQQKTLTSYLNTITTLTLQEGLMQE